MYSGSFNLKRPSARLTLSTRNYRSGCSCSNGSKALLPKRVRRQPISRFIPGSFQSVSVCAELILNRVISATSELPQPASLRVATCCMLFEQLLSLFGRYEPLLGQLRTELFRAIYMSPAPLSASDSPGLMADTYMRRTYFEETTTLRHLLKTHEYQSRNYELQLSRQLTVLNRAIGNWQFAFLRTTFAAWKGTVVKMRLLRSKHARLFIYLRTQNSLRLCFYSWVEYVHQIRHQRTTEVKAQTEQQNLQLEEHLRELSDCNSTLAQSVESRQHEVEGLRNRVAALEAQLQQANSTIASQRTALGGLCENVDQLLHFVVGDVAEHSWRSRVLGDFLDQTVAEGRSARRNSQGNQIGDLSTSKLLEWVNTCLQLQDENAVVRDVRQSFRDSRAYITLLRVIAPHQISQELYIRVLNTPDIGRRAELVVQACESLGIYIPLDASDIIEGNVIPNMLLLLQLFARSTNSFGFAAAGAPALRPAATAPLYTIDHSPESLKNPERLMEQYNHNVRSIMAEVTRWQQVTRAVQDGAVRFTYQQLSNGQDGELSAKEELDKPQYTQVSRESLSDIVPDTPTCAMELDNVETVLAGNFKALRKIYQFYSASDTVTAGQINTVMSASEFWRLCTECKIPDKKRLPRPVVQYVFTKANQALRKSGPAQYSSNTELQPSEFVECLVRLAHEKYCDMLIPLSDKLQKLITEHLLPHASLSTVDEFKTEVYGREVQAVLRENRPALSKIFRYYATNAGSDTKGADDISFQELTLLAKDAKLLDTSLSHHLLQQIFVRIQDDDDPSGMKMMFHEFLEAIVAVAAVKVPSPFTPLHQKLQQFLTAQLFPPLEKKCKL
eukprot:TRINITY_DN10168_c0_g1_i1.p1 TRINITY_DN10168_c0_g1~~TRINITY_DN10168_c0_g1_i1.p1  ORF type:complete len:842 (+),score=175.35 TRINITY_DN10168_c0_g1_i1:187-2712(+)